jgi:transposase-like protein
MGTSGSARRRNRSWPEALKREIVAASLAPGASVSVVARRYDVNANQVFNWRQRYRDGSLGPVDPASAQLVPVMVSGESRGAAGPSAHGAGTIEIEVADKYRIRVGSGIDEQALRRVLDVLERR